jgi:hypothetical protein
MGPTGLYLTRVGRISGGTGRMGPTDLQYIWLGWVVSLVVQVGWVQLTYIWLGWCSDTLTFGKPNSSRQWYNNSLSSLIFIFPLNIWRVNQLERSCSLLSEQINTAYSQQCTSDSLTTVLRIFSLLLSSNCRSLNQISLKGPSVMTLAYYSCKLTAKKLYTRCVFHCEMTVCTVFLQSHQRDFILR